MLNIRRYLPQQYRYDSHYLSEWFDE